VQFHGCGRGQARGRGDFGQVGAGLPAIDDRNLHDARARQGDRTRRWRQQGRQSLSCGRGHPRLKKECDVSKRRQDLAPPGGEIVAQAVRDGADAPGDVAIRAVSEEENDRGIPKDLLPHRVVIGRRARTGKAKNRRVGAVQLRMPDWVEVLH
jgi:hypothetical protein